MRMVSDFDLNLSPRSEGSPSKVNDFSSHAEKVPHQSKDEAFKYIDLNQPLIRSEEFLTNAYEGSPQINEEGSDNDKLLDLNIGNYL